MTEPKHEPVTLTMEQLGYELDMVIEQHPDLFTSWQTNGNRMEIYFQHISLQYKKEFPLVMISRVLEKKLS